MSSTQQPGKLARQAYAGFIWQILGFSLNTILSVLHIVIMARLLSPEIFGQFAVATVIIALTRIVTEFGLGPALVQKAVMSHDDVSFVFIFNMATGLLVFCMLYVLSNPIAAIFDNLISPLMVKILAINLLLQPLGLASKAMLLRSMDFRSIFVATNLSYFIGMLVVGGALAVSGYGIWSLIIGLIVTSAVASLYFLVVSPVCFSFAFNRQDSHALFKYGLGLTAIQGINQLSLLADKLIFTQVASNTFLGLYERSQRLQQMPGIFVGGVLDTVMFSTLSRFSTDKIALGKHFFNFVTIAFLTGVYLSVFVFTFAKSIILLALGQQWLDATSILKLLALLISFQLLARMSDTYVRATGTFRKSIRIKLTYLSMIVVFAALGYQQMQINGTLLGIILASAVHAILMILMCQRDCGYSTRSLMSRLRPGIVLAVLLIVKNVSLLQMLPGPLLLQALLIIVTDAGVIFLLIRSNTLAGRENREYIDARARELWYLLCARLGIR